MTLRKAVEIVDSCDTWKHWPLTEAIATIVDAYEHETGDRNEAAAIAYARAKISKRDKANRRRRSIDSVYSSLGMEKVRGALGGVYYE